MQQNYNNGDEINLLIYWNVIKRRKKLIWAIVGTVTIITVIVSFVMPNYYKAKAVLMPVGTGRGGMAAMAGQFGGLASLIGLSGAGGQTPLQQMEALLETRTLAEEIIDKYDLLRKKSLPQTHVKFANDIKKGTLTISVEFKDPKLATDVANGYVEGLQEFINKNSLTVAKRNRIFIEKQLAQNKRELLEAGKELNEFYKTGKVSSVESKIDVLIEADKVEDQQSQQEERYTELETLQRQKKDIETKIVKGVPQQVYLQYLTLRRNLLTQINTLLTQQYEMAKIEEAKDELAFQVIDPARLPEKRSKPKRKQMVVMAFVCSLFIGMFVAFFIEYIEKMKAQTQKG